MWDILKEHIFHEAVHTDKSRVNFCGVITNENIFVTSWHDL